MNSETKNSKFRTDFLKMTVIEYSDSIGIIIPPMHFVERALGSIALRESDVIYLVDYKRKAIDFFKNRYGEMDCIEFDSFEDLLRAEFELQKEWQSKQITVIKVTRW